MPDPRSPDELLALASERPGELDAALSALILQGADAAPILLEVEAALGPGEARKRLRRARHQLESRGIQVGERERERSGSVLRPPRDQEEQALLTPIDLLGRRVLLLLVPRKGGARLFEIGISDQEGVLGVAERDGKRRDVRRFLRDLQLRAKGSVAPAAPSEVRALIARAAERGVPPGLLARRLAELTRGAGPATPGERLREAATASALDPTRLDSLIAERIESGRLLAWPLLGASLDALAERLDAQRQSSLVLSQPQQLARSEELIDAAAAEILSPDARDCLAARVEETAVFLAEEGDAEGVAALLALAERLRGRAEALAIPYLRRCLDASLELARQQREQERSGQLILPG